LAVHFSALAVWSTRRWTADVNDHRLNMLNRRRTAIAEWVSGETGAAGARRQVVHHLALCILAAGSRARILAVITDTGLVRRTVCVDNTLRSATFVRIAEVVRQTDARPGIVSGSTHCVSSARRRIARINVVVYNRSCNNQNMVINQNSTCLRGIKKHTSFTWWLVAP